MSSPMMTRMFGFACCAAAGAIDRASIDNSRARQTIILGPATPSNRQEIWRMIAVLAPLSETGMGSQRPTSETKLRRSRLGDAAAPVSLGAAAPHRIFPWSDYGRLVARGAGVGLLDLFQDLAEVVALRSLQRRELFVRHQMLLPQLLTDREHVPVVLEGRYRTAQRPTHAHCRLLSVEG